MPPHRAVPIRGRRRRCAFLPYVTLRSDSDEGSMEQPRGLDNASRLLRFILRFAQNDQMIALIASHVIQYQAPFFRLLAAEPELDLEVLFCSTDGAQVYRDAEMQTTLRWDLDLLGGYRHRFLRNFGLRRAATRGSSIPASSPRLLLRSLRRRALLPRLGHDLVARSASPPAACAGRRCCCSATAAFLRRRRPRRRASAPACCARSSGSPTASSSAACSTPTTTATTAPTRARFHPRAVGHRQRPLRGRQPLRRRASARRCAARFGIDDRSDGRSSSPASSCRGKTR